MRSRVKVLDFFFFNIEIEKKCVIKLFDCQSALHGTVVTLR